MALCETMRTGTREVLGIVVGALGSLKCTLKANISGHVSALRFTPQSVCVLDEDNVGIKTDIIRSDTICGDGRSQQQPADSGPPGQKQVLLSSGSPM